MEKPRKDGQQISTLVDQEKMEREPMEGQETVKLHVHGNASNQAMIVVLCMVDGRGLIAFLRSSRRTEIIILSGESDDNFFFFFFFFFFVDS